MEFGTYCAYSLVYFASVDLMEYYTLLLYATNVSLVAIRTIEGIQINKIW